LIEMQDRGVINAKLQNLLAPSLGSATAEQVVEALSSSLERTDGLEAVYVLLGELQDLSEKVAEAAIGMLPELQRREALAEAVQWLDLGLAFAHASGAAALRYARESPLLISLIEPASMRHGVVAATLELVEEDHTAALEFLRAAPELVRQVATDGLEEWAMLGIELVRRDPVAGIELIRQMPAVAGLLSRDDVRMWFELGVKLVTTNSLGKTDYFGTVEFFRTSPAALAQIHPLEARPLVLRFASHLVDHALDFGTAGLYEAPRLLECLPSDNWRMSILQYGLLLAGRDAPAGLAYLRRAPEIVSLLDAGSQGRRRFEQWFQSGMEVVGYSIEAGRAYFAVETHQALAAIDQALSGVPLRRIARSLTLFAEALCGRPISIQALADGEGHKARTVTTKERVIIRLPALLRRHETYEDNVRFYTIMTAHEAGHVEFGTYDLALSTLTDLVDDVQAGTDRADQRSPQSLSELFALYPQPGLMHDLWALLEDARVEYLLRHHYPGLRRDLARLAAESVKTRTLTHGLTVRELIVDQLLLLSTADDPESVAVPDAVADIVADLWSLCRTVVRPDATAEAAVRTAHRVYRRLDELLTSRTDSDAGERAASSEPPLAAVPPASETTSADYRPVLNWEYRGSMDPGLVKEEPESQAEGAGEVEVAGSARSSTSQAGIGSDQQRSQEATASGRPAPSFVEEVLGVADEDWFAAPASEEGRRSRYPEWDAAVQDYRSNWCSVIEREAEEGSSEFVEQILAAQRGPIRLLRRYFESLRPAGVRRLAGQVDGQELDLDALVRRVADIRAGTDPSDHIYIREERRERDVATAVLVDVSGSTSRQIATGQRVIDVEKEGLVMLCEALDAIGDQFALYGYTSRGRNQVELIVIKDFDDPVSGRAARGLGGIMPLHQNRDGAAIRHATRRLSARQAKTKLLVLISDGRPLDDGYKDDYSLEDTKMALREARMKGIEPFCITVDRDADQYLSRMYGEVRYIVIDRIEGLPDKLPKIYHRLTR
jgi:cobalamin biosynthesis protein CobT